MKLEVDVQVATADAAPGGQAIRSWIAAALVHRRRPAEVSVRLVDEAEMAQLNRRYRGREGATNALSFPAGFPSGVDAPLLGDIVACPAVILREAAAGGQGSEQHWARVFVHGTLHLLGYDHIEDREARRMERIEARILKGLGFPRAPLCRHSRASGNSAIAAARGMIRDFLRRTV